MREGNENDKDDQYWGTWYKKRDFQINKGKNSKGVKGTYFHVFHWKLKKLHGPTTKSGASH